MRAAIEARDAEPVHLSPYAPGLNPIKPRLARHKTVLRQASQRPIDGQWQHVGWRLERFPEPNVQTPAEMPG